MDRIDAKTVAGCVLAGGRSSRMGGNDKALAELAGRPLVEQVFARLRPQVGYAVINANVRSAVFENLAPVVADTIDGLVGPLAGILAGLRYARARRDASHVATAAVDTPFFPSDLVTSLSHAISNSGDLALAASNGRLHPAFGLFPVALADDLESWLRQGADFSVRSWTVRHSVKVVDFPFRDGRDPFFNINTGADLATARRLVATGAP